MKVPCHILMHLFSLRHRVLVTISFQNGAVVHFFFNLIYFFIFLTAGRNGKSHKNVHEK